MYVCTHPKTATDSTREARGKKHQTPLHWHDDSWMGAQPRQNEKLRSISSTCPTLRQSTSLKWSCPPQKTGMQYILALALFRTLNASSRLARRCTSQWDGGIMSAVAPSASALASGGSWQ